MNSQQTSLPERFRLRKALTYVASAALVASTLVLGTSAPAEAAACGSGSASYAGGAGSSSNPWQIETAEQLIRISAQSADWDEYFVLTEDIDLLGCEWTPIGDLALNDPFEGSFDGQGFTIEGLFYNGTSDGVGLFGWVGASGTVANVGVVNVDFTTTEENIGGLVGVLDGTITGSFATGSLEGKKTVGGLVGKTDLNTARIENSYSTASATATDSGYATAGGLVGFFASDSNILDSWSSGAVTGPNPGGLTGSSDGTATNSFWDTQTSLQASSGSGTGKTSDEMSQFSTFDGVSWDIVNGWEAFNFSSPTNYWGICANDGYPFLLWQYTSDPCVADSSGSSGSTDTSAGVPGIFLYVAGPVGRSVAHSPVYYGTDRVAAASEYEVRVLSSSSVNSGAITLASGTLPANGSIPATMVRLPQLEPGTYLVRMTGKHTTGKTLQLTAQITVGPAGTFTSIGPNIPVIR